MSLQGYLTLQLQPCHTLIFVSNIYSRRGRGNSVVQEKKNCSSSILIIKFFAIFKVPKTVLKNTYYTVNTLSKIKINLFYFYLGNGLKKDIAKIPTDLSSAWCQLLTGTFINVRPYWGIYFHTEGYIKLRNWKEKNQTTLLFSSMLIWEIIVRLQKPKKIDSHILVTKNGTTLNL